MSNISTADALHNFKTIWEYVECGIVIVDALTREIMDVNPVAARMFGDDPAKMIGKRCHKFICPAEADSCPIMDKGMVVDRSERKLIRANGEQLTIIKSVAKIQYQGRLALLESFTDISHLKEAEAKLLQFHVAEQASQAKSDFLSRMSHEMRTPLNAIIGMTKIADGTEDAARLKYCLSKIGVSATHLLGLINDVLDMSKIEAGKLELNYAPLDIEDILKKVCGLITEQMGEKGIAFHLSISKHMPMRFNGDELRLSQVLANLMSNAFKFTAAGGSITLAAEELQRRPNSSVLRFSITDSGIGIAPEQLGKLFDAFEQTDASISRRYGGTGLGLSISKSIVEKMNGSIAVASTPGKGSTFTVTVELDRIAELKDDTSLCGRAVSGLRLLIADAAEQSVGPFDFLLECGQNSIDDASSGEAALNLLQAAVGNGNPYDAIFVAHALPDMSGLDLVEKSAGLAGGNKFVVLASFSEWTDMESRARNLGVVQFLAKPLFPSDILDILEGIDRGKETAPETAERVPDFSAVTILLAEDVPINREIFAALLEKTHIHIDTAEDGREALEKFSKDPDRYSCIVMDVQMPEMDGYEATKAIRSLECPQAKNIPILAMTANAFTEDIKRCLDCGMNDHLAKPIDEAIVMDKLRTYCLSA